MFILNRGRSEKYADQAGSIILYPAVDYTRKRRRIAMKKIKLFPFPHVEIRISVSDEMERDYWRCRESIRRAVETGDDQKTFKCEECSWKNVKTSECNGVCAMNGLYEQMRGGKNG